MRKEVLSTKKPHLTMVCPPIEGIEPREGREKEPRHTTVIRERGENLCRKEKKDFPRAPLLLQPLGKRETGHPLNHIRKKGRRRGKRREGGA